MLPQRFVLTRESVMLRYHKHSLSDTHSVQSQMSFEEKRKPGPKQRLCCLCQSLPANQPGEVILKDGNSLVTMKFQGLFIEGDITSGDRCTQGERFPHSYLSFETLGGGGAPTSPSLHWWRQLIRKTGGGRCERFVWEGGNGNLHEKLLFGNISGIFWNFGKCLPIIRVKKIIYYAVSRQEWHFGWKNRHFF